MGIGADRGTAGAIGGPAARRTGEECPVGAARECVLRPRFRLESLPKTESAWGVLEFERRKATKGTAGRLLRRTVQVLADGSDCRRVARSGILPCPDRSGLRRARDHSEGRGRAGSESIRASRHREVCMAHHKWQYRLCAARAPGTSPQNGEIEPEKSGA